MQGKKRERRLMALMITPQFLEGFVQKGVVEILESPIPEDAEYVATHYDFERDMFVVVFYHQSFEIVPDGIYIPKFDPNAVRCKRIK